MPEYYPRALLDSVLRSGGLAGPDLEITHRALQRISEIAAKLDTAEAPELIRDTIGTALTAGALITITVSDGADTITIAVDTAALDERTRDTIGTALVAGAGITVTVSDVADTITIASTLTGFTDESAQDAVGTILTDSATLDFTYDDATPSITAIVKDDSIGASKLADTAVTPGTYTRATVTVDQQGRITAASSGSGGVLPMVDGSEPPNLVYDEDGQLIYFEV